MVSYIAIPLKRTSELDLVKPLKDLVASNSSSEDVSLFNEPIESLNKLRANATSKLLDLRNENSLELLERYYDQISSLELKCPPSEVQIPFKWKDAFDKGSSIFSSSSLSIASMSYEKICVLFNIGAIQSQIACIQGNEGINNDVSLKWASKYFQGASGIFEGLKHTASSALHGHDLSPDLCSDVLHVLSLIMLSQAQETFFYKASSDNMKDNIIARVANQCEEYYADTLKNVQLVKISWPEKDWLSIISMKQAAFHGIAEYYQSMVSQQNKEFGEQIARLAKAVECLKGAESRGGTNFNSVFRDHLNKAAKLYEEAKKDNDFIYHAKIPDYRNLSSIGKASLAKPTPIPSKFKAGLPDPFEKLLPVSMQHAVNKLDGRKQEVLNGEIALLRESTQTMNAILSSLNLPASLEDTSGAQLPPSIREKYNSVRSSGGIQAIETMINELPDLLQRNKEILTEIERQLTSEEESDNSLKNQFKARWTRTPSAKLNAPWREHIKKYHNIFQNAIEADNKVKQKFYVHREKILLLSSESEQSLINAIPSHTGGGTGVTSASCVVVLKKLMDEVEAIKNEREVIESELKNANFNDMKSKFLSSLASDGAIDELALTVESIGELYGPYQKQARASKEKQEQLMAQIQRNNDEFVKLKGTGNDSARETFLSELAAAYDMYNELMQNLKEGTKFYNDLTQLLVNLQNKVADFVFARKAEMEELCKSLQNDIVTAPTPQAPNAPAYHNADASPRPPRPPPPAASYPMSNAPPQVQAQPNYPYGQPYQPVNPYQNPYSYPAPPLPTGFNPYVISYNNQGQQAPNAPPQNPGYPYPQQPGGVAYQYPSYPYPQQPPPRY